MILAVVFEYISTGCLRFQNNMAASFNRSSWRAKGDVVSTDLRAFNNIGAL